MSTFTPRRFSATSSQRSWTRGTRAIVLDLSEATFLDSMALGVILSARKRLTAEQGHLEVVVPTPEIRRIFEITMLDRVLDLHETQAGALRASGDAAG
jgi:anti-sigma B factor antagonist